MSPSKFKVWSYMLRCEEQVMQEKHLTRVNKQTAIEKSPNSRNSPDRTDGGDSPVWTAVWHFFKGTGCRYHNFCVLIPVLISIQCR